MNTIKTISLLSLLTLHALLLAAEPSTNKVTLQAKDGTKYEISADVAKLSKTIANLLKDIGASTPIPLPNFDNKSLETIIKLMATAYELKDASFNKRINDISEKMQSMLANKVGTDPWIALAQYIDYLDIDMLKAPWANTLIQVIHAQHKDDSELIAAVITSLGLSDEFTGLLAKYWHLNYGKGKEFILPKYDYGFSVEELKAYNKLPNTIDNKLDLSALRINNLTGLKNIENILNLQWLDLSSNQITTIQTDTFNGLNELEWLDLSNNKITKLPRNIFADLHCQPQLDSGVTFEDKP